MHEEHALCLHFWTIMKKIWKKMSMLAKSELKWKPIEYTPKVAKFILPTLSPTFFSTRRSSRDMITFAQLVCFGVCSFFSCCLSFYHCQQANFNWGNKGTWWWTKKQEKKKLMQVEGKKKNKTITIVLGIIFGIFQGRPYDRF